VHVLDRDRRSGGGRTVLAKRTRPRRRFADHAGAGHETLKQKVKRVWRNLTGYKFDVSCPLGARSTCTETGKDRGEAQAKCISRHPLCWVNEK
jgi:hypothetical protein